MRVRWLGVFALVVAISAGAAAEHITNPTVYAEAPTGGYVVVHLDTGVRVEHLQADGLPPTLEQQGFRRLAVPEGMTAEQFAAELDARPDVLSAEPDATVRATAVPNDSFYSGQQASYLEQLGMPQAWDLHTGDRDVIVAVLDSGLDAAHPDLAPNLWQNSVDIQNDGIDRDGNGCVNDRNGCRFMTLTQRNAALCGYTASAIGATANGNITDDFGHGTQVGGLLGAAGDNGQGIAGVAWNVRLLTVKVLDCNGEGSLSDVAFGIEYAVRAGADIINLSLAAKPEAPGADSQLVRNALQLAQNQGVIVVAAAGNIEPGGTVGTGYPAAYTQYPNLIAVGGSSPREGNTWATFSRYGPAIDFAAPGKNVVTTARTNVPNPEPYVENVTGGTSFAAPFVSGMFALMMSRNSNLNPEDYIQAARDAAIPAPEAPHGQNWAGSGIVNIGGALARVPMSITGEPLREWKFVPGGTRVEARIDAVVCGETTAVQIGGLPISRFTLRVKTAAEQPGCGSPGKRVDILVGGTPAQPTFTWPAGGEDLAFVGENVSTVPPPPGAVVIQTLNGGWSNIAHLEPDGALPGAASTLPNPWSAIFKWNPLKVLLDPGPGAYDRFVRNAPSYVNEFATIQQFDAYWVNAPAANVASLNPNAVPGRAIELQTGWNNFTYTGPSQAVGDALDGISGQYTQVLEYDNLNQVWRSYLPGQATYLNDFGGLVTLRVYWVLMKEPATLVMD